MSDQETPPQKKPISAKAQRAKEIREAKQKAIVEEAIEAVVAEAPPLTPVQRARLKALFGGTHYVPDETTLEEPEKES